MSFERKERLRWNKKHNFHHFKGLSFAKNCLRPESTSLSIFATSRIKSRYLEIQYLRNTKILKSQKLINKKHTLTIHWKKISKVFLKVVSFLKSTFRIRWTKWEYENNMRMRTWEYENNKNKNWEKLYNLEIASCSFFVKITG